MTDEDKRALQEAAETAGARVPRRSQVQESHDPEPVVPVEFVRLILEDILLPIPEERYCLPGLVPAEAYTLIAGALSSYKSTLLLYLMVWRATGHDLLGLGPEGARVDPGIAILMSYEDIDKRTKFRLHRILQNAHYALRDKHGSSVAKEFLANAVRHLHRLPLTGQYECTLVHRVGGEIRPNHRMLERIQAGVRKITTTDAMLGLDPLRLAIVGSQNDDDGADMVVHIVNHISSDLGEGGGSVLCSHTNKAIGTGKETADNYQGASYATSGSALYSQHARSNFFLSRLPAGVLPGLFGPAISALEAEKQPVAQLTHGRLSHGAESGMAYVKMEGGILVPMRVARELNTLENKVARALPLVIATMDRMRDAGVPRISETTLCADGPLCKALGAKGVRTMVQELVKQGYIEKTGKSSDVNLTVTALGRGL